MACFCILFISFDAVFLQLAKLPLTWLQCGSCWRQILLAFACLRKSLSCRHLSVWQLCWHHFVHILWNMPLAFTVCTAMIFSVFRVVTTQSKPPQFEDIFHHPQKKCHSLYNGLVFISESLFGSRGGGALTQNCLINFFLSALYCRLVHIISDEKSAVILLFHCTEWFFFSLLLLLRYLNIFTPAALKSLSASFPMDLTSGSVAIDWFSFWPQVPFCSFFSWPVTIDGCWTVLILRCWSSGSLLFDKEC